MWGMPRDTMPTPRTFETSIHDMTIDEWKGLALRCSIQIGRHPGTDGEQDPGSGMAKDIDAIKQAIGRPPSLRDGELDEGSGLSKMLVEHHRAAAKTKSVSTGAIIIALAGVVVTAIQHFSPPAAAAVPVPVPVVVPAASR